MQKTKMLAAVALSRFSVSDGSKSTVKSTDKMILFDLHLPKVCTAISILMTFCQKISPAEK